MTLKAAFPLTAKNTANCLIDEGFINRLCSGDDKSFCDLYDKYAAALYGKILEKAFKAFRNEFKKGATVKGNLFVWMLNITRGFCLVK
jgi:hypothetical protein